MSKELENLKRLSYENACCRCQYYIDNKCSNKGECIWLNIETALDRLEELEELVNVLAIREHRLTEETDKQHRVLEIIKECVGIDMILFNADQYGLTKEEFDLLKEVLL